MKKLFFQLFVTSCAFFPVFSLAQASTIAQNTATLDNTETFGYTDNVGPPVKVAQPFTASVTANATSLDFWAEVGSGSPTDDVVISLYSDSGGSPNTLLETSSQATVRGGTPQLYTVTFTGSTQLTSGTTYWLVASRTGSLSSSDYYYMDDSSSAPPYGGVKKWEASSWSAYVTNNWKFTLTGSAGGSSHKNPFDEIFGVASSTASSTISIVDNPTQDVMNGFILFFMSFGGVVWFFKKR